jgi:hypothetical protein
MAKATCVLSTPPTNTSATQRSFLSNAAGFAAGGTALALATVTPMPAAAAPKGVPDGSLASPALRAAVRALADANDRLALAKVQFEEADRKMEAWTEANPEPDGKRQLKRWCRRWREVKDATLGDSWDAQLEAEKDFRTCQMAVAKVTPRDEDDLMLKAAAAAIYDKVKHASYGDVAIISYSVVLNLFELRLPAVQS